MPEDKINPLDSAKNSEEDKQKKKVVSGFGVFELDSGEIEIIEINKINLPQPEKITFMLGAALLSGVIANTSTRSLDFIFNAIKNGQLSFLSNNFHESDTNAEQN